MTRRTPQLAAALVAVTAATTISLVAPSTTAHADQPAGYGPSAPFDDSLMPNDGPLEPMRNKAKIYRTTHGYRFAAAQQDTHLRLSVTPNGRLRFRDSGTRSWKSLPSTCTNQRVNPGIAATCRLPAGTNLVEVHPRLGNDYVDGRGLPARIQMAVLGDAGRDTLFGGRGNDFLNVAQDRGSRASGGGGKDWIRGGDSRDRLRGGAASDWIVGLAGRDAISGGAGKDRIFQ